VHARAKDVAAKAPRRVRPRRPRRRAPRSAGRDSV